MNIPAKLAKNKKRRILVLSAGGMQAGIQAIYVNTNYGQWEILSHAYLPYPQRVADLIEKASSNKETLSSGELGWLDYKVSMLFLDGYKAVTAQLPKSLKTPHCIALNRLTVWKGQTGENLQQAVWDLNFGDAQFLASSVDIPVITDFQRRHIFSGGAGMLPAFPGNFSIAGHWTRIVVFINIGIISRLTIIDKMTSSVLVDSDTCPGTSLINKCARASSCPGDIDRDGSFAAQGKVNSECLDKLATSEWFRKDGPRQASPSAFDNLLNEACCIELSPVDRVATVTALTARTIYEFYRREYAGEEPEVILISGGGAKNQTLMEFLKTYFDTLPVKNIEEYGIPAGMRIPLAVGLTLDSYLSGEHVPWETGNNPKIGPLGNWVLP